MLPPHYHHTHGGCIDSSGTNRQITMTITITLPPHFSMVVTIVEICHGNHCVSMVVTVVVICHGNHCMSVVITMEVICHSNHCVSMVVTVVVICHGKGLP